MPGGGLERWAVGGRAPSHRERRRIDDALALLAEPVPAPRAVYVVDAPTAGAFVTACALNPQRDEAAIARALRDASPTAMPNIRIVSIADRLLGREGRMIAAIGSMRPGIATYASEPFRLDLE